MENKKQSSVEWLYSQLQNLEYNPLKINGYTEAKERILEKAKELHKKEIVNAWCEGYDEEDRASSNAFSYYNETFIQ